jgi:hypothetical protein
MDAEWMQNGCRMDAEWMQNGYRMDAVQIRNGSKISSHGAGKVKQLLIKN